MVVQSGKYILSERLTYIQKKTNEIPQRRTLEICFFARQKYAMLWTDKKYNNKIIMARVREILTNNIVFLFFISHEKIPKV